MIMSLTRDVGTSFRRLLDTDKLDGALVARGGREHSFSPAMRVAFSGA